MSTIVLGFRFKILCRIRYHHIYLQDLEEIEESLMTGRSSIIQTTGFLDMEGTKRGSDFLQVSLTKNFI